KALGPEVVKGLRFVCSDMWNPYLQVIAAQAGQALQVLDRFHITTHLNQAVDQVRRAESTRLRAESPPKAQHLKHLRWPLLRRGSRVRGRARQKLNALLASKLASARAWELKETFSHFWGYRSVTWAESPPQAQRLKHLRWPLLRRGSRVRWRARQKLNALLASKLATARAWELKETFF